MSPENRPQSPNTKDIHPGIVPIDEGGERPLPDARSLEDINTGEIQKILPETPYHGFESLPPTDQERAEFDQARADRRDLLTASETKEKKGKGKLIAAIGGIATVAVTAAALFLAPKGESNHTENVPTATQPVATGEATPGASQENNSGNTDLLTVPTNVVETGSFKDLTPEQQATIKQLEGMSVDEFRKLPLETQLMFGQFVYDNNAPRVKYAMEQLGFDYKDYADRVVVPAPDNTGQQAYDSSNFILDMTANLYTADNKFDSETARKVLPLSVSASTAGYKEADELFKKQPTGLTYSTGKVDAYKTSTEQGVTHMIINVSRKNTVAAQDTLQLTKFKDVQGKDRATWQQTRSIATTDPRFDNTVK